MSMLLPGLAPDLAWCLGMDVPKRARVSLETETGLSPVPQHSANGGPSVVPMEDRP